MSHLSIPRLCAVLMVSGVVANAQAQTASSADMNNSNNPLHPAAGLNFQDQYVGSYHDLDDKDSNAFLLRGILPHRLFGAPQIMRATMPVVTSLDLPPDGRTTGTGDLNIFDIILFKAGNVQVGIGPQITMPTASDDTLGTGKWQAGLAGAVIAPQSWGLLGGLVTWQASFAGDDDRRRQNNAIAQPVVIYNLPAGWYLRSSATWTFDLETDSHYIPVGLGAGKVWKYAGTTWNAFVEPQWTVEHHGPAVPQFQVFMGLNLQFPL
ncbi:hypothetical protein [Uliginosibacterium sp. H1]|uniref:hypothetical protein n=1 Tax=Uliginosibacterium sp. H1 TaxID=3114757 RepID=UPI002E189A0D|nr:hypothetical protein [Uliginosibacterium sp. H1]